MLIILKLRQNLQAFQLHHVAQAFKQQFLVLQKQSSIDETLRCDNRNERHVDDFPLAPAVNIAKQFFDVECKGTVAFDAVIGHLEGCFFQFFHSGERALKEVVLKLLQFIAVFLAAVQLKERFVGDNNFWCRCHDYPRKQERMTPLNFL